MFSQWVFYREDLVSTQPSQSQTREDISAWLVLGDTLLRHAPLWYIANAAFARMGGFGTTGRGRAAKNSCPNNESDHTMTSIYVLEHNEMPNLYVLTGMFPPFDAIALRFNLARFLGRFGVSRTICLITYILIRFSVQKEFRHLARNVDIWSRYLSY